MKSFAEALKDGFAHIKHITDPILSKSLHEEGILGDEGYYTFSFGEHKEYELAVEPAGREDEDIFYIALYKNRILLTEKLQIWIPKQT